MAYQEKNTFPILIKPKALHEMRAEVLTLAVRFATTPGVNFVKMHYVHDGLHLNFKSDSGIRYEFTIKRAGDATPFSEVAAG